MKRLALEAKSTRLHQKFCEVMAIVREEKKDIRALTAVEIEEAKALRSEYMALQEKWNSLDKEAKAIGARSEKVLVMGLVGSLAAAYGAGRLYYDTLGMVSDANDKKQVEKEAQSETGSTSNLKASSAN